MDVIELLLSSDVSTVYTSVCDKGECSFSSTMPHYIIKYVFPTSKKKKYILV